MIARIAPVELLNGRNSTCPRRAASSRWREDPRRAGEQPYKAVVDGDRAWLMDIYAHEALAMLMRE